jgi:hypothetical protein
MIGKVSIEARNKAPPDSDGWRELRRFGVKLGLPAGLAGIFAVGSEHPAVIWLILFQGFSAAIAALSMAIAIVGGTGQKPSARYWIDAFGFGLAAFFARVAGVALR